MKNKITPRGNVTYIRKILFDISECKIKLPKAMGFVECFSFLLNFHNIKSLSLVQNLKEIDRRLLIADKNIMSDLP